MGVPVVRLLVLQGWTNSESERQYMDQFEAREVGGCVGAEAVKASGVVI